MNSFFESTATSNEFTPAPATDGWFIFNTDLINRVDGLHFGDPKLSLSFDTVFSILIVANGGDPRSYGPQYYRSLAAHGKTKPKLGKARIIARVTGKLAKGGAFQFVVPTAKLPAGSYRLAIRLTPSTAGAKTIGLLTKPFTVKAKGK